MQYVTAHGCYFNNKRTKWISV